ncbi:MAG: YggS family pyridoxal phosphate-dependent enzyme [Chloroflexota bacterium]
MSQIKARIEAVTGRMAAAARRAGRPVDEITLVAVTKTHPVETVIAAYQAGLRHFGENRVEEGTEKIAQFAAWLAEGDPPPVWHMIGHVQSRKVGEALRPYRLIHSVDSLKLAERIDRLARRDDAPPVEILLECNVSGEEAKYGFAVSRWSKDPAQFKTFIEQVSQIAALDKIVIRGLMTMAPLVDDPKEARPTFESLAALRAGLWQELPDLDWSHLSMGMTDDFEVAIEAGATIIRVGRALFGERNV